MTSPYKRISLIFIAILVLVACTDQADNNNRAKTVIPSAATMTESKVAQLQKEALEGNPDAQYNLAYMYENGIGVPKNEAKALELYQQAADQGHSAAQNNLDVMSSSK